MFRQIFESSVLEYRQPPDGYSPVYNGYLLTPPRIYFEEIALVHGMFTIPQRTPTSQFVVCVQVSTKSNLLPGRWGPRLQVGWIDRRVSWWRRYFGVHR